MPRLVVTLTMRPHFASIMSWTTARASVKGAVVCTATKRRQSSGVTSQNLSGCCQFAAAVRRRGARGSKRAHLRRCDMAAA